MSDSEANESEIESEHRRGPGRIGKISKESYKDKFIEYEKDLIVDDKIVPLNSAVYMQIATDLKIKSNDPHKVVYQAFKRYTQTENKSSVSKIESESHNDSHDDNSDKEEEFTLFDPSFKISKNDLSYEINIKDMNLFSYPENDLKLQSEWSDTLNDIIWQYSRLPCAWRISSQKNVANEKVVMATCRSVECMADMYAYTECNQSKLKIVIKNFNPDAVHIEKRALKNSNKTKVAELLKLNKPSFVQAELANELIQSSDYCPAHLPNQTTLRKLKQRENEKTFRDPDPVRSLCMLKRESMFHKSIADIGLDPFYCFFSTPEQKEWLRLSTRYKRCIISVDSTGKENNFLYEFHDKNRCNILILASNTCSNICVDCLLIQNKTLVL